MSNSMLTYLQIVLGLALLLLSIHLIFSGLKQVGITGYWLHLSRFLSVLVPILIWVFTYQNSQQTNKRVDNLEEKVKPENILNELNKKEYDRFMKAVVDGESLTPFFPRANSIDLKEKDYEVLLNQIVLNFTSADYMEDIELLRQLLHLKFPEKAINDKRIVRFFLSDFGSLTKDWTDKQKRKYLVDAFQVYTKDSNSSNALFVLRLMFILENWAKYDNGQSFEPVEYLFNKLTSMEHRNSLRRLLTNEIPELDKPFWISQSEYDKGLYPIGLKILNNLESKTNHSK